MKREKFTMGLASPCLVAVFLLSALNPAGAAPQGQQVVHGQAVFGRNGGTTTVTTSHAAIINYESFNIGLNEAVNFVQPSASSRVLNRVQGELGSHIDGTLSANGIVYIVNPAGVYFNGTAVVDVGGLYAAAGNLSDADFLAGVNRFTGLQGTVANEGIIRAGNVVFAGAEVLNTGTVLAPGGFVVFGAGDALMVNPLGSGVYAKVEDADAFSGEDDGLGAADAFAVALGTGRVENTGSVEVQEADGRIALAAETVVTTGDMSVSGGGGSIDLVADAVTVSGTLLAPGGSLLIDPVDATIEDGGPDAWSGGSSIDADTITTALNGGTAVTVEAQASITVDEAIVTGGGNATSLTFADEDDPNDGLLVTVNFPINIDDGGLTFEGDLVSVAPISGGAIQVDGTASLGDDITATTGNITVAGTVNLTDHVAVGAGGQVDLQSTVDGAFDLNFTGSGMTTLGGAVTVRSLSVAGPSSIGAQITADDGSRALGDINLVGDITLLADTVLQATGAINVGGAIDGDYNLTLTSGTGTDVAGTIGTTVNNLTVQGAKLTAGTIDIDGELDADQDVETDTGVLDVGGNVDAEGTLIGATGVTIGGESLLSGDVTANAGNIVLTGDSYVDDGVALTAAATSFGAAFYPAGDGGIGTVNVDGDLTLGTALDVDVTHWKNNKDLIRVTNGDVDFNNAAIQGDIDKPYGANQEIVFMEKDTGQSFSNVTAGDQLISTYNWAVVENVDLLQLKRTSGALIIWDGGGADDKWSSPENWQDDLAPIDSDALVFAGNDRLANINDAYLAEVTGISFDAGAGAFTLSGSDLTLDGDITNSSAALQTINISLDLGADSTVGVGTSGMTFSGAFSGNYDLAFTGTGVTTLSGGVDVRSLDIAGPSSLGGQITADNVARAVGDIDLGGDVTLIADTVLEATGVITANGSIDGDYDLTLDSEGGTNVEGTIGTTVNNLTVRGAQLTANVIDIDNSLDTDQTVVSDTGGIDVGGSVVLGGNVTINAATAMNIQGSVDGDYDVVLVSGTGTDVAGTVGATINNLGIQGAKLTVGTIDIDGDLNADQAVETDIGGIDVVGSLNTTAGDVTAALGVNAGSTNVTGLIDAQGGKVAVVGNMTAGSVQASQAVTADSANVTGTVGAGTSIGITNNAEFGGAVTAGTNVTVGGNVSLTNDVVVTAAGTISFQGDVGGLNNNLTLTSSAGSTVTGIIASTIDDLTATGAPLTAGTIDIDGNLDADQAVATNVGVLAVAGDVDAESTLVSQTGIDIGGTADFGGNVTATGGNVDVDGDTSLTGPVVITANGAIDLGGGVLGGVNDLSVVSGTGTDVAGTLVAGNLTVDDSTLMAGAVDIAGNLTAASTVQTDTGSLDVDGALNTTAGNVISAGGITAGSAGVAGNVQADTTIAIAGNAVFGGQVTGGTDVTVGGTSALSGDVTATAGEIALQGASTLNADILATGGTNVTFGGTVNGGQDLTVNAAGRAELQGTIGGIQPLTQLDVDADGGIAIHNVDVLGNVALNTTTDVEMTGQTYESGNDFLFNTGRVDVPEAATVYSFGNTVTIESANQIAFTQHDKLSVDGNLLLRAPQVIVGDLFTTGTLTIRADDIQFLARAPGNVLQPDGLSMDRGVDVVGVGGIFFQGYGGGSAAVSLVGGQIAPLIFAAEDVATISGVPGEYIKVQLTDSPAFELTGQALDAIAMGLSSTEVSTALAGVSPDESDKLVLPQEEGMSAAMREELARLGVFARDVRPEEMAEALLRHVLYDDIPDLGGLGAGRVSTPNLMAWRYQVAARRISRPQVEKTLDVYRGIFFEKLADGTPGASRAPAIGKIFDSAAADYLKTSGRQQADGAGLAAFLTQSGNYPDAIRTAASLGELFHRLEGLGLGPLEYDISIRTVLDAIPQDKLGVDEFMVLIEKLAAEKKG